MSSTRLKSALAGALSSQGLMLLGMASALVTTPIVLRGLRDEAYGINILVQQILIYVGFMDFGFGEALRRRLGQAQSEADDITLTNRLLSNGVIVFGLLAAAFLGVGWPLAPRVTEWMEVGVDSRLPMVDLFRASLLLLGIQLLTRPFTMLLFARHRQVHYNVASQSVGVLLPWLVAWFVTMGYDLYSFILANVLVTAFTVLFVLRVTMGVCPFVKISLKWVDGTVLEDLFSYGRLVFVIAMCDLVVVHSDRFVTGAMLSVAAVTGFSLSVRIPELVIRMTHQLVVNLCPYLVEYTHAEKNEARLRQRYREVFQSLMLIITCMLCGLAVTVGDFVSVWVGREYYFGDRLLWIFLSTKYLLSIHLLNGVLLGAKGKVAAAAAVACMQAALHLYLSITLAEQIGIVGILIAAFVSQAATATIVNSWSLCRSIGANPFDLHFRACVMPAVFFVAAAVVVFQIKRFSLPAVVSWTDFWIMLAVAAAVFIACLLLLVRRREYDMLAGYLSRFGNMDGMIRMLRGTR